MNQDEIVALGASLHRINQKLLKSKSQAYMSRIWYQGDEPYFDMFLDLLDNEIVWFQFTLRGKCLSWNQKQLCLQTGSTNELVVDDITYYSASKVITGDSNPDIDFIKLAQAILTTRAGDAIFDKALALFHTKN
ncbi:hypothetical protein [Microcoleus sp. FACHB-672]|uniref:hypothetical protein n=1 Tax=Microcoleus sp. FACHB-672 TaxID=2692825 RepID=UPI00168435D4|nr:hypothetical protein [Microcoleus sp. FACHB-672]MBD2041194.1 hypothetical protein [Microcoleus sp. FACHB-672]